MSSSEIRRVFLDFFQSRGHKIVPSAPIVVKDDPTLMFTNAGMNQFKDAFLGNKAAVAPRVADTQKCLRVSGKHNDLEEVGIDTYHHTMFEMLGNWSFGDYFKKDAIGWAWELLTDVYGIEKDRLYVTIFQGDEEDGLGEDSEAKDFWKEYISEDRILRFSRKDNFWEMGDTGPCGPCSEIHVDLRSDEERVKKDARDLVNNDHPQVIEIWNLVFIQFNRSANGKLQELPAKHVDTGMGFERLCVALQGKKSNYDTDVFQPLIKAVAEMSNIPYGKGEQTDIALRVIADHIRAVAFTIADGQLPSNGGAGYVIRRILRRAVRYGYSFLNLQEPFIYKLVAILANQMGDVFPEIRKQQQLVEKVVEEEEASFLKTLKSGLKRIEQVVEGGNYKPGDQVDGSVVFELYDTFGFPVDLTRLILSESKLTLDEAGFQADLNKQKERSRSAAATEQEDWVEVLKDDKEEFVGYDYLETDIHITRYRRIKAKGKEQYQLVFNVTPFYAEGGGQVGDTGFIEAGSEKVYITDTKKENNLIIHFTDKLPADPSATFKALVNGPKRALTANNHSATHLLHEALREVLGSHVEQRGSLVNADYLRFDFSHFSKVTDEELAEIEQRVNEKIRANFSLEEKRAVPIQEAKEMGAMALFGEKYGDVVRVIKFGTSVELCGGIHVQATGQIGLLKILSEGGVAAGIRRIEAVTGPKAIEYYTAKMQMLDRIAEIVKNDKDVIKGVESVVNENQQLKKELEKLTLAQAGQVKEDLKRKVKKLDGINFIGEKIDLSSADAVKNLAYSLKNEMDNLFLVLGNENDGKATLTIMIDDKLVEQGWHAGNLVREAAKEIQGGGGGQPFFATAGGKNPAGIEKAIAFVKGKLEGEGVRSKE